MKLCRVALGAVAALALGAVATSASAGGDLKGDYRASSSIWTGAYWGVHLGGGASNIDWLFTPVNNTRADQSGDGVVGGFHLGYNWQLSSLVLGIEGSATLSGINGGRLCPNATFRCEHENDFLGSVRGRLGVAVGPALFYGTGGVGAFKSHRWTGQAPSKRAHRFRSGLGWWAELLLDRSLTLGGSTCTTTLTTSGKTLGDSLYRRRWVTSTSCGSRSTSSLAVIA
jgi:outer membrane immunogenic protein